MPYIWLFIIFNDILDEITTILTPSTSEGGVRGVGVVTFFILEVLDYKSATLVCVCVRAVC